MPDNFLIGAQDSAPRKCYYCRAALPKPFHGKDPRPVEIFYQQEGWFVTCECHAVYVWQAPHHWHISHELAILRPTETIIWEYDTVKAEKLHNRRLACHDKNWAKQKLALYARIEARKLEYGA